MIRIQEASLSATMQMQVLFKPSKRMLHGSILSLHALFVMYYVEAEKGNFTRFRKLSNVRRSAPMRPSAIRIPQPWRACTTSIAIQFNFAGCGCNLRNPHSANMNSVYGVRDADRGRPRRRGATHIGKFAETGEIALLGFHSIMTYYVSGMSDSCNLTVTVYLL